MFINDFEVVPFKALQYTAGETNYGGRVTDDWDRRTLMCMLKGVYNAAAADEGYSFSESGIYRCPPEGEIDE